MWNQATIPDVSPIADTEANNGQGDISTKWYGCLIIFDIYNVKGSLELVIHINGLWVQQLKFSL